MGKWVHRIVSQTDTLSGECQKCGPVVLTVKDGRARCSVAVKQQRGNKWEQALWKKYGLRREDLDSMLIGQSGLCAICPRQLQSLHLDHCHRTGRVRGFLCPRCNLDIARFDREPDWLPKALAYLDR